MHVHAQGTDDPVAKFLAELGYAESGPHYNPDGDFGQSALSSRFERVSLSRQVAREVEKAMGQTKFSNKIEKQEFSSELSFLVVP